MIEVFGHKVHEDKIKEVCKKSWISTHFDAEPSTHATIVYQEDLQERDWAPGELIDFSPQSVFFPGWTVQEVKDEIRRQKND